MKKTPEKRAGTPTSGCACAHSMEPPTGNVSSGQNTRKKPGGKPQLSVAHARTTGSPFGVT